MTEKAEALSRPLVGSSMKRRRGRVRIYSAMHNRFFSPPLMPRRCHVRVDMIVVFEIKKKTSYLSSGVKSLFSVLALYQPMSPISYCLAL
jgi:hypothetical protein